MTIAEVSREFGISPDTFLVITGSSADWRYFSEQAYELAKGPKELVIVDNQESIAKKFKGE